MGSEFELKLTTLQSILSLAARLLFDGVGRGGGGGGGGGRAKYILFV